MNMIEASCSSANDPQCHFTYHKTKGDHLAQGDLLAKTEALQKLLEEVHAHYTKDDYTYFLVLTQSCDLVRRKETCKARYITLAAVRPLALVVKRELEKHQQPFARKANVCGERYKSKMMQFVERILNNNETDFFYLNAEPTFGLSEPSCAFLRLPISIRAYQHYDLCLAARKLSLTDVFQAKLGWLIGNLYSRVGTDDWVPDHATQEDFQKRINDLLNESCQWVNDEKLEIAAKNAAPEVDDVKGLREIINGTHVASRREKVLERVTSILSELKIITDSATAEKIAVRLKNDSTFAAATK